PPRASRRHAADPRGDPGTGRHRSGRLGATPPDTVGARGAAAGGRGCRGLRTSRSGRSAPPTGPGPSSTYASSGAGSARKRGGEPSAARERLGYRHEAGPPAARAERLADRGYGDAYTRADLERRGLPTEAAMSLLEPEAERASRFADRGLAWLSRRGFALSA